MGLVSFSVGGLTVAMVCAFIGQSESNLAAKEARDSSNQVLELIVPLAAEIDELTETISRMEVTATATSGDTTLHVYPSATEAELQHDLELRALYAVWVQNYGEETANALLHSRGIQSASGGAGRGTGGAGSRRGGVTGTGDGDE